MVHLTEDQLIEYALLDGKAEHGDEIPRHVSTCDECCLRLERIRAWITSTRDSISQGLPSRARRAGEDIFARTYSLVRLIPLRLMEMESSGQPVLLAADGVESSDPAVGLRHRATLFSENPELILRVMQDPQTRQDSLHLIGTDAGLTSNVLIRIVDPPMDFVTDDAGTAVVGGAPLPDLESLKWQVCLPDAMFTLSPLEHPPADDHAAEVELGPDSDNRIGVTLKKQPGGLTMRVRILRVDGRDDLQRVRLVISQGGGDHQIVETSVREPCVVTGLTAETPIDIRIFAA